jgi:zinc/manganese transport system substrate-binding protein
MKRLFLAWISFLVAAAPMAAQAKPLKVVTTLSVYASIAKAVGGDRVTVDYIARGDQDPHFVKPKPSYALKLQDADVYVTTGLDLELWGPTLVDKSGNSRIRDGQIGYVTTSRGVHMLDIPSSASRAAGDVHIYGNPHVHTSPINARIVAANIATGLKRVDPAGASTYDANLAAFNQKISDSLYGPELVKLLGADTLDKLATQEKLIPFLRSQKAPDGSPLISKLGGWLGEGMAFRGKKIVSYHKNWIYFVDLFGLHIVDYVEAKPGIPPSARHVHELINEMNQQHVKVLLAASYFDPKKPNLIAKRTGCKAVIVPMGLNTTGPDDYFKLVSDWVDQLKTAFTS